MRMDSTAAGGNFWEAWTDCWLLPGRIGISLEPYNVRHGFGAILYVSELQYQGWPAASGLQFAFRGTAGAAYLLLGGHTEECGLNQRIPVGYIVVVGGAYYASGGASLTPKPNEGIGYEINLTQPLYFVGAGTILGYPFAAPFWFKPRLFKGTLGNILGKEGEVRIVQTQKGKAFSLDVDFDTAQFVNAGITTAGTLVVTWKP
jgi:hypothetical protein